MQNQKLRRRSPLGYRVLNNPLTAAIKEISGQETDEGEHEETKEAKKGTPPHQTTDEDSAPDKVRQQAELQ